MNVMPVLIAALLQAPSPIESARRRAHCETEATVERLAKRCAQLLAGPPPSGNTLAMWGTSALAVDEQPAPLDMVALDAFLGTQTREVSWAVWPIALEAGAGACVIRALGQPGGFASHVRFDRAPLGTPTIEGARRPDCPSTETRRTFDALCRAIHATRPHRTRADAARAQRPPALRRGLGAHGVSLDLSGRGITPAEIATAFGPPSTTSAAQSVHLHPPWFDGDGRRCSAEARYAEGRLTRLRVWRTPQRPPPPSRGATTPLVTRLEQLCDAMHAKDRGRIRPLGLALGAQRFDHLDALNLWGLWSLRMLDLVERFGPPAFVPRYQWARPNAWRRAGDQVYYLRSASGVPQCALLLDAPDGTPTLHAPELTTW